MKKSENKMKFTLGIKSNDSEQITPTRLKSIIKSRFKARLNQNKYNL